MSDKIDATSESIPRESANIVITIPVQEKGL